MQIDRRTFLKGSAAAIAVGGLGTGLLLNRDGSKPPVPGPRPLPGSLASEDLRRCLSMGPINAPDGDDQDLRSHGNLRDAEATGSRWIKLWVGWEQIQPLPPERLDFDRLGDPDNPGLPFLKSLDAQVEAARTADPALGVVLTTWHFPRWSNGTASLEEGSAAERRFEAFDRLSRRQASRGDREDRRSPLLYRVPPRDQLTVAGYWGRWVRFLLRRYERFSPGVVLELLNEPNLQWWPQQAPATTGDPFDPGEPEAAARAALMIHSAQEVARGIDSHIPLAGPGTSDYPLADPPRMDTRTFTGYASFTSQLLNELDTLRFRADPTFIWTQHNYADMLLDLGMDTETRNRAAHVRELLTGRWTGWPQIDGDTNTPGLWLTEGGVDLRSRRIRGDVDAQAELLARNLRRMADRTGDGRGVGMVTNYLNLTELHYDTGLRGALERGAHSRPARRRWAEIRSVY